MEFQINQVFTKEEGYPPEAAVWCNERGDCYIEEFDGGYRIVKIPDPTSEELEKQKLEQAKAERAEAVKGLKVDVDGMTFDGNEKSQTRMARMLAALNPGETTAWVLADDTIAEVTREQLQQALRLASEAQTQLWVRPYAESSGGLAPADSLKPVGI